MEIILLNNFIYFLQMIRGAKKDKKINITINKNSLKNYLHIEEAIPIILELLLKEKVDFTILLEQEGLDLLILLKKFKKD